MKLKIWKLYKFCPSCGKKINKSPAKNFKCPFCGWTFYANPRPTSSIIPLYKGEVLVYERAFEPSKRKLDIIGGFLEYGEDPLSGGIREFEEETGVKLKKKNLEYLGIFMGKYPYNGEIYSTLNIIYTIKFDKKIMLKPSEEIEEFLWLPINKIKDFVFAPILDAIEMIKKLNTNC